MSAIADAMVYAVTYINLREGGDDEADNDVDALESIAAFLHESTAAEQDDLAAAAERALASEKAANAPRAEFLRCYEAWMEEMFGEEWTKNCRTST